MLDQALGRLPHHDPGQQKQQSGLGKGRKGLHFAMPVVMLCVRWFARNSHGDVRHNRGAEVDKRMTRFRQNR